MAFMPFGRSAQHRDRRQAAGMPPQPEPLQLGWRGLAVEAEVVEAGRVAAELLRPMRPWVFDQIGAAHHYGRRAAAPHRTAKAAALGGAGRPKSC